MPIRSSPRSHHLLLLLLAAAFATCERWTEEDETHRIEQLKAEEQRQFNLEQQRQTGDRRYISAGDTNNGRQVPQSLAQNMLQPKPIEVNWCYHCATPMHNIDSNMRHAITQFLKLRRTAYPSDAVVADCSHPQNLTSLRVQHCLHRHCQTLVLTDHQTASTFTIRGCAESFGAINDELLRERGDNTCSRLHDTLDIQECICSKRKYCYPGADRNSATATTIVHYYYYRYLSTFLIILYNIYNRFNIL